MPDFMSPCCLVLTK